VETPPGLLLAGRPGTVGEAGLCGQLNSAAAGHGFIAPRRPPQSLSLLLPSVALTRFAASSPG